MPSYPSKVSEAIGAQGNSVMGGGFAKRDNQRISKDTNAPQDPLGPGGPGAGDLGPLHGGGVEQAGGIWNTADPNITYTPDYYNPFIGGKAQNQPGIDPGPGQTVVNPPVYQEPGEFGPGGPGGYFFETPSLPPTTEPSLIGGAGGYDTSIYGAVGKKLCDPRDPNCYGQR